jgi:hypothetical protein
MPIKTRVYLKGKFENGDYPNENDFIDLFDSYWHQTEDTIPRSVIEMGEPIELSVAGSGSTVIPADTFMEGIVLLPSVGGSFKIGETFGGMNIRGVM